MRYSLTMYCTGGTDTVTPRKLKCNHDNRRRCDALETPSSASKHKILYGPLFHHLNVHSPSLIQERWSSFSSGHSTPTHTSKCPHIAQVQRLRDQWHSRTLPTRHRDRGFTEHIQTGNLTCQLPCNPCSLSLHFHKQD